MGWIRNALMGLTWAVSVSWGWAQPAFVKVPPEYKDGPEVFVVPNMPRIRDQGPLGLCQSFSGATMLQHYYCSTYKVKNCAAISNSGEISPLSVWGYLTPSRPGLELGIRENHRHINLDHEAVKAANRGFLLPAISILNMYKNSILSFDGFRLCSERAFSYDEFIKKHGQEGPEGIQKVLQRIDRVYQEQRKVFLETEAAQAPGCDACLQRVVDEMNTILQRPLSVESNSKALGRALRKESFGEFLYEVVFNRCGDITMPLPKFDAFPAAGKSSTRSELRNKMIEVIKMGHPVSYGAICVERSVPDGCGQHNIVVSGYKKMCDPASRCNKEAFKVHNSWGVDWQNEFTNDGWVDADALINSYYHDKVASGSLYWFPH